LGTLSFTNFGLTDVGKSLLKLSSDFKVPDEYFEAFVAFLRGLGEGSTVRIGEVGPTTEQGRRIFNIRDA
jgi:hypothetical protein